MSLTDTAARSAKARPTGRVADRRMGARRSAYWRMADPSRANEDERGPDRALISSGGGRDSGAAAANEDGQIPLP